MIWCTVRAELPLSVSYVVVGDVLVENALLTFDDEVDLSLESKGAVSRVSGETARDLLSYLSQWPMIEAV